MDPTTLGNEAYQASQKLGDTQTSAPGLLNQLKQNLVGIFSKDNPVVNARNTALSDYLSEAANTRASLLPSSTGDVPGVAGRPLTFSPTQQDAIVTSRNAAALAPLVGWNEILKGMFGSIGDIVGNAGNIYSSTIQGLQTKASALNDLYGKAIEQQKANQSGSGGIDLASLLAAISSSLNVNSPSVDYNSIADSIYGTQTQPTQPQPTSNPLAVPASLTDNNKVLKAFEGDPGVKMNSSSPGYDLNKLSVNFAQPNTPSGLYLAGGQGSPLNFLKGLGINFGL